MQAYVDNCASSKEPDASADNPGCEQHVYAYDPEPGSAVWTAPEIDGLETRLGYDEPHALSADNPVFTPN